MPIRRRADPTNAQCVWDTIRIFMRQKLPPEPARVVKQLCKVHGFPAEEWETAIEELLADKLIEKNLRKEGKSQIYKIPTGEMPLLDGRDWYCFECHQAGDVVYCKNKTCHRVYHKDCVAKTALEKYRLFKNLFNNSDSTVFLKKGLPSKRKSLCLETDGIEVVESNSNKVPIKRAYDSSLCIVCNMIPLENHALETSELNYLFRFVLQRIISWIPDNVTHKMEGGVTDAETDADLAWRANHLFFEHKDMSVIKVKINSESYPNCHSLLSDVLTIKHNIGIFHGVESQEYAATDFILRDTLHDLGEIIGCVDCYKHSNEKINSNWFSLPCRTPHKIVWAKQGGYCYWPSKVIKEGETHCDVRFFGGKHERALIAKQFIKPMSTSKASLKLRNSAALSKAIEEMELHQKLLSNSSALEAFIATSNKKVVPPMQLKSPAISPKKTRISKPPIISETVEEKKPIPQKKTRITRSRKSNIENAEEPILPAKSPKKRGRGASIPVKEDRTSPEIGMDVPLKQRSGDSSATKKDRESSPEIGTAVSDIPEKKKRRNKTSKKKVTDRLKVDPVKRTRSSTKLLDTQVSVPNATINDVEIINISDGEDNIYTFSGNLTLSAMEYGGNYEQLHQVTSSTEFRSPERTILTPQEMQKLDHPFSDEVEMMRRTLEALPNKKEIINYAVNCMQKEIDRITENHNDHLKRLFDSHNAQISETKKKQWCYYCEQDAIYHCCWNTAYCSTTCQQQHWQAEHKKVCRRKK